MKRFKELTEELFNEGGGDMMPADEMTLSELKIACFAANNILERLEGGAMIQRWQISAIVKAKEELASVYTSISADEMDMDDMDAYDDMEDEEEPMYVGFEYPSMYGEETKYVVKGKSPFYKQDHYINTHETPKAQLIKKNIKQATHMDLETAKKVAKELESHPNKYKTEVVPVNEETDYEVDVEGLPKMYVKGDNPSQVKNNLRKVVKNPDMIRGVERVAKATLQKMFRDKAAGKDTEE